LEVDSPPAELGFVPIADLPADLLVGVGKTNGENVTVRCMLDVFCASVEYKIL